MPEAAVHGFSPAEARRLARLLQRAAGAPLAATGEDERRLIERARAAGLCETGKKGLVARPEARAFLRRLFTADGEQAFAAQHGRRETVEIVAPLGAEGRRAAVTRNLDESPLAAIARLRGRDGAPFLPVCAVDAGERLLADFTRGGMQPRITASWEPRLDQKVKGMPGGQADLADSAMAARARLSRAVEAMGPELSGVALDVCCFHKGLETVERERQWPARSAKLMLRTALLALSRHYAPPARSRPLRHWGEEGFRPGASS